MVRVLAATPSLLDCCFVAERERSSFDHAPLTPLRFGQVHGLFGMPAIRFIDRLAPLSWLCFFTALICTGRTVGHQEASNSSPVDICVVIRAYWGHGGASQQGLHNLITSLQRQSNPRYNLIDKTVCGFLATSMSRF